MTIGRVGVCCNLVSVDLEHMSSASFLLPFRFRKSLLIHHRVYSRHVMREVSRTAVAALEET